LNFGHQADTQNEILFKKPFKTDSEEKMGSLKTKKQKQRKMKKKVTDRFQTWSININDSHLNAQ
jgi:hypothetical protein